jgi:hypothetical protein
MRREQARQRLISCRCSIAAQAIESPSKVAVPRPISSRMTSARSGLVEDRGGLDHLDHEGRASARQIVGGADAREQPVDDADAGARRHEGAHLRQERDQRVLAQEGRLTRHVRAGDQPDRPASAPPRREVAGIGDEGLAVAFQRLPRRRVAAALDRERQRAVDFGPDVVVIDRQFRPARSNIELAKRMGGARRSSACASATIARQGVRRFRARARARGRRHWRSWLRSRRVRRW